MQIPVRSEIGERADRSERNRLTRLLECTGWPIIIATHNPSNIFLLTAPCSLKFNMYVKICMIIKIVEAFFI